MTSRLLLLPLLAFSIRASAQSDAAFSSSLAEIRAPLAAFAQFKAKPKQPIVAAPKAPGASEAVWKQVLETVKRDGKYKAEAGQMPGSFSIEDSSGDIKGDHSTQEITFLGLLNEEEQFEAMGALLIVTESKLDPKDGNFHIDQWMFETDVYGDVKDAGHGTIVTTTDGKKLSAVPEKLNPADPRIQAQYDSMLKHWAERKGA